MIHKAIAEYCLSKPGAYLDFPFGPDILVIKVQKRIFAQLFQLKNTAMATFNCDQMTGEFYRNVYPGTVTRGYHCPPIQQPYFNTVRLDKDMLEDVIIEMIDHSYERVVKRLTKLEREALQEKSRDEDEA